MPKRLRTMDDLPLDGKRVIVRVDFNVSVGSDGVVDETEDYRIQSALATIEELQQRRCKVLLLAHRGRPQEDREGDHSMEPIHNRLERLLKDEVKMLPKLYGQEVEAIVGGMEPGAVAMFPNVRLDDREVSPSDRFGEDIASSGDVFINEAFSVSHRAHTSVALLPRLLPSAAGRRTVMEVEALAALYQNVERPYVAIVSGSKLTTKIGMLRRLLGQVDTLCVGGQIANVFIAAQGNWSDGPYTADEISGAKSLLDYGGAKILVPSDVVIGTGAYLKQVGTDQIPEGTDGLWDIGPQSVKAFLDVSKQAKTIMWNGPVGKFEEEEYAAATKMLAEGLAELDAMRVVGGGDTVNALERYNVAKKYNHVSVGGGAMIAFLEGKRMPGLESLFIEE